MTKVVGEISYKNGVFLGDVSYVLSQDVYAEIYKPDHKAHYGLVHDPASGHDFMVAGTAYGDGCYRDQYGNQYSVDAGNIGIVPTELVDPEKIDVFAQLGHDLFIDLGLYIEGPGTVFFEAQDGIFDIRFQNGKHIHINTKYSTFVY